MQSLSIAVPDDPEIFDVSTISNISTTIPDVSFDSILKVPCIVKRVNTKRSEEPQIITSSPYKEALLSAKVKVKDDDLRRR